MLFFLRNSYPGEFVYLFICSEKKKKERFLGGEFQNLQESMFCRGSERWKKYAVQINTKWNFTSEVSIKDKVQI